MLHLLYLTLDAGSLSAMGLQAICKVLILTIQGKKVALTSYKPSQFVMPPDVITNLPCFG